MDNDNGVLNKTHTGEMIACLILSSAYRRAVAQESGGKSPNFTAGCSLVTFIKQLFCDPHAEMILEGTPDNVSNGENFRDVFLDISLCASSISSLSNRSNDGDHSP